MMANKDKKGNLVKCNEEFDKERRNAQEEASEAQRQDYVSAVIAAAIGCDEQQECIRWEKQSIWTTLIHCWSICTQHAW